MAQESNKLPSDPLLDRRAGDSHVSANQDADAADRTVPDSAEPAAHTDMEIQKRKFYGLKVGCIFGKTVNAQ